MRVLFIAEIRGNWGDLVAWADKAGAEVIKYPTCAQGRRALENDPDIDLAVIDADADDECGLKLLRALKNNPALGAVPLIVAGAKFDAATVQEYYALGVEDILLLPTARETFQAKIACAVANGRKTVLLVDDEPTIVDILEQFFQLQRYKTASASSGEIALGALQHQNISLVVTDIIMPGITGIDLLIEVKANYPWVPVILITGHAAKYSPADVIAMGADAFFAKPFINTDLMYTVRRVLSKYANALDARRRNQTSAKPA